MIDSGLFYQLSSVPWDWFGTLTFGKAVERQRKYVVSRPFDDLFDQRLTTAKETIVYAGRVPGPRIRFHMFYRWLRQQEKVWGQKRTAFILRHERGELTDRPHFHFLMRSESGRDCSRHYRLAAMQRWEMLGGGMARIRRFDHTQAGTAYLLKNLGANEYEMSKFALNDPEAVTISELALQVLATKQATVVI